MSFSGFIVFFFSDLEVNSFGHSCLSLAGIAIKDFYFSISYGDFCLISLSDSLKVVSNFSNPIDGC